MKNLYLSIVVFILQSSLIWGQITENPTGNSTNCSHCEIKRIEINNNFTFVYLSIKEIRSNLIRPAISFGSNTFLITKENQQKIKILGLGNDLQLDQIYPTKKGEVYDIVMIFPKIPPGLDVIDIVEEVSDGSGYKWTSIKIENPDNTPKTSWNESSLKIDWESNGISSLEGVYENTVADINSPKYRLALKYDKQKDQFILIYLSGANESTWNTGDIKAFITKTASTNIFKVKWYLGNKSLSEDLYITFDIGLMRIIWTNGQSEQLYLKLFPTTNSSIETNKSNKLTGTGFAISDDGYIVTNQHVIHDAKQVLVRGVKGDFSKTYQADIIIEDKNNDLAIIKINDADFTSAGLPPYKINSTNSDVGTSVYVLGYPLLATMGDEVKLTNGIISSKTGFQGDITTYQISVPVQPGNSGGPLFDSNGNIIGIVNAKHVGAENASYAIKTSYLINLIQVMNKPPSLPTTNTISNKSFSDQVKHVKEFVYIVEVN